jgi:hypothetical protein
LRIFAWWRGQDVSMMLLRSRRRCRTLIHLRVGCATLLRTASVLTAPAAPAARKPFNAILVPMHASRIARHSTAVKLQGAQPSEQQGRHGAELLARNIRAELAAVGN